MRQANLKTLQLRRWDALKQGIFALPPESAYEAIKLLALDADTSINLDALVMDGMDLHGLILRGALQEGFARRLRGYNTADHTSERQWENYLSMSFRALEDIRAALALEPLNGLAATILMAIGVDQLEEGLKEQAEATLLKAQNLPASGNLHLMMAHSAKWGGSHDVMWRIARSHFADNRSGAPALIARAHTETWLYLAHFDDAPGASEKAQAYFAESSVRAELLRASDYSFDKPAPDPAVQRLIDGWMLGPLENSGQIKPLKRHMKRLGDFKDPTVMSYSLLPGWAHQTVRTFKCLFA